jgi:glycosyltransferase involved in cell wall biosynthesis
VLLLNTYHYLRGGDCTHVFALADLLRSNGHEVRFFGMKHEQNLPCDDSTFWVEEIDFERLNRNKNVSGAARVLGRTIYSPESRRRLDHMLDSWTPDVAHVHNILGHLSPSVLDSLAKRRIPIVWTLHDYRLLCPNTHFLSGGHLCEECRGQRYHRCVANRCKKGSAAASMVAALEASVHSHLGIESKVSAFIAPSRFLRSKFIEFGFKEDKVRFIRNFLPDAPSPNAPDPARPAAYIGQLATWKGVETAISAMAELSDRRLTIVGDGPDRERLERLATSAGVSDRVDFTGALDRAEVMRVLSESAFVVAPSLCYENCPYSVMEALAAGRPVIASDIGGLPELVVDGQNGLTVPPGDASAMAAAMARLFEDRELFDRLSSGAAQEAGHYGEDEYYRELMDVYATAVVRSAAGHSATGSS